MNFAMKKLGHNCLGLNYHWKTSIINICVNTLDIFASRNKKYLYGNNMPLFSKKLVNAHRKRTCLRNKFLEKRTETNRVCYNKQREFK